MFGVVARGTAVAQNALTHRTTAQCGRTQAQTCPAGFAVRHSLMWHPFCTRFVMAPPRLDRAIAPPLWQAHERRVAGAAAHRRGRPTVTRQEVAGHLEIERCCQRFRLVTAIQYQLKNMLGGWVFIWSVGCNAITNEKAGIKRIC